MTAPLDHEQVARDLWLADQLEQSRQRILAVREEAERIISESRKSIQPRLRQVLAECEADWLDGDYRMVGSYQSSDWGD